MNFVAPARRVLPLTYFNDAWVQTMVKHTNVPAPLAGLTNLGNSCFMNSVFQCLAYSPGLPFFAEHIPNLVYDRLIDRDFFLHHFGELVKEMKTAKSTSPDVFFHNLSRICPGMQNGYQQDAHEFLIALLNLFDSECSQAFSVKHGCYDTAVHALFGIILTGKRTCQTCQHVVGVSSRLLDVALQLDSGTIEECFASFMKSQINEHVCDNCGEKSIFHEELTISRAPEILVVTMMRFASNGSKIERVVDFGLELDLGPFCENKDGSVFELFAVIVHNGHQMHKGHFMCYVMCTNGIWYSADDSRVAKVSTNSVLMSRPYILFYKRKVERAMKPILVKFGIPESERPPAQEDSTETQYDDGDDEEDEDEGVTTTSEFSN